MLWFCIGVSFCGNVGASCQLRKLRQQIGKTPRKVMRGSQPKVRMQHVHHMSGSSELSWDRAIQDGSQNTLHEYELTGSSNTLRCVSKKGPPGFPTRLIVSCSEWEGLYLTDSFPRQSTQQNELMCTWFRCK